VSPPPNQSALHIERLRQLRNRPATNLSIATDLAAILGQAQNRRKALQSIDDAWQLVPPNLRSSITPLSLTRGTLTVRPKHAAAWSQFNLWLRSGGLRTLQSKAQATLNHVKPAP
jgi:hypothetical protein